MFGGFDVRINGIQSPSFGTLREQRLLARLVLLHGKDISCNWIARSLWPDNPEEQGQFYFRKALSNLRKALGEEASRLQTNGSRIIRINLDGAFVDVIAFDKAVRASDLESQIEAANLHVGPLFPECQEDWASQERARREQLFATVLERLSTNDILAK